MQACHLLTLSQNNTVKFSSVNRDFSAVPVFQGAPVFQGVQVFLGLVRAFFNRNEIKVSCALPNLLLVLWTILKYITRGIIAKYHSQVMQLLHVYIPFLLHVTNSEMIHPVTGE